MEINPKEIIRNIKLCELGIKSKPDGYDKLMSLRGLNSFKVEESPYKTYYGKTIDDIKFEYNIHGYEHISIKYETWLPIDDLFKLWYIELHELTMWAIGSDYNLEGVPISFME